MKDLLYKLNPRDYINKSREKEISDQQTYNELTTRFSDKKAIAHLIIGTPTPKAKTQNKSKNTFLFVLLIVTILFKITYGVLMSMNQPNILSVMFLIIYPLINIYIAFGVFKYLPTVYNLGAFLAVISLFKAIFNVLNDPLFGAFDLLLAGALTALFLSLKENLFPNYKPKELKTDETGNYIL